MLHHMGAVASIMVAFTHLQKMTFSMAEFLSQGQNEEKKINVVLICYSIFLSRVWSLIHC